MNVTYLFGAGASCNCLPTYKNFYDRFNNFLGFIQKETDSNNTKDIQIEALLTSLKIFQKEFIFHNTPDTIVKKYFHLGDDTMVQQIKNIIIVFFIYEQTLDSRDNQEKQILDKRYDSFIASLLRPIPQQIKLIDNIQILTWNYDLQFEICFSKYMAENILSVQEYIQGFPKIDISDNGPDTYQKNKFSLVHLNGIAFPKPARDGDINRIGSFFLPNFEFAVYLSETYNYLSQQHNTNKLLKFAWENIKPDYSLKSSTTIEKAVIIAEQTDVLVINGYSFPAFNREIDKELFKKMQRLSTIYIQSPQASEIKNIIQTALTEGNSQIIFKNVEYWNQFLIPSEWSKVPETSLGIVLL